MYNLLKGKSVRDFVFLKVQDLVKFKSICEKPKWKFSFLEIWASIAFEKYSFLDFRIIAIPKKKYPPWISYDTSHSTTYFLRMRKACSPENLEDFLSQFELKLISKTKASLLSRKKMIPTIKYNHAPNFSRSRISFVIWFPALRTTCPVKVLLLLGKMIC